MEHMLVGSLCACARISSQLQTRDLETDTVSGFHVRPTVGRNIPPGVSTSFIELEPRDEHGRSTFSSIKPCHELSYQWNWN